MGHIIQVGEEALLADIERRLVDEFPCHAPAAVNTVIRKEHARFETSQIRDFVTLFVEKRARRELKAHRTSVSAERRAPEEGFQVGNSCCARRNPI